MVLQRYSSQEALNRILRSLSGQVPATDVPNELSGGMVSWDEAISYLAELAQNSYPGVTGTIPQHIQIATGSFAHAHTLMHLYGIGEQRFGSAGSHLWVQSDGTTVLVGDATTFTDFSVPLTRTQQGANNKPDFDTTDVGLLFPQNDTTEKIYFTAQFQHDKKLDSVVYPHVHYIQSATGTPIFVYSYRWYNPGSNVPTAWSTGTTADGNRAIFTRVSGSVHQIASFPGITPPANEAVSSNLDIILWRQDNVVSGDVLVKYVDIHYERDGFGSDEQYTK